ncbi:MAG: S6e family ribosomal protein, partial [Candidatus Nitrosocaldus sp.]
KKYVLLTKGIGLRKARKGERVRKLVRGNVISEDIYQINAVLVDEAKSDSDEKERGEEQVQAHTQAQATKEQGQE